MRISDTVDIAEREIISGNVKKLNPILIFILILNY